MRMIVCGPTYLSSHEDQMEFDSIVKEAGIRLGFSRYIRATYPNLLMEKNDFVRWCEFVYLSVRFSPGFGGTSIEDSNTYEQKSIANFHEESRRLCEMLATEELVYASEK
jgi:hypothetical protein